MNRQQIIEDLRKQETSYTYWRKPNGFDDATFVKTVNWGSFTYNNADVYTVRRYGTDYFLIVFDYNGDGAPEWGQTRWVPGSNQTTDPCLMPRNSITHGLLDEEGVDFHAW